MNIIKPASDKGLTVQVDDKDMGATSLVIYKDGPWCSFVSEGVTYYTNKPVTISGGKAQVEIPKPVKA